MTDRLRTLKDHHLEGLQSGWSSFTVLGPNLKGQSVAQEGFCRFSYFSDAASFAIQRLHRMRCGVEVVPMPGEF